MWCNRSTVTHSLLPTLSPLSSFLIHVLSLSVLGLGIILVPATYIVMMHLSVTTLAAKFNLHKTFLIFAQQHSRLRLVHRLTACAFASPSCSVSRLLLLTALYVVVAVPVLFYFFLIAFAAVHIWSTPECISLNVNITYSLLVFKWDFEKHQPALPFPFILEFVFGFYSLGGSLISAISCISICKLLNLRFLPLWRY